MKQLLLVIIFSSSLLSCPAYSDELPDAQDTAVLNTVLESELNDVIKGWQLKNPSKYCMILSDQAIEPSFPQSNAQVELEKELTSKDPTGRDVDWESILFGSPEKHKDYVMPDNHIIPAEVVDGLFARSEKPRLLPAVTPKSELRLILVKSSFIDRTFRSAETSEFVDGYPCAFGLIEISLPGYSRDGNVAGVYCSTLATRIGGGGTFVLLKRVAGQWVIQWTHTAWIE